MNEPGSKKTEVFFPKQVTVDQTKDTGMALILISLLIGYFTQAWETVTIAVLLLIINMVFPKVYRPVAKVWIGISTLTGTIMSKVILTIVFYLLVVPIGKLRISLKKDSLQLKKWKQGTDSVFERRDHPFGPNDLEKPY